MDEFTCTIDGCSVLFWLMGVDGKCSVWQFVALDPPSHVQLKAVEMVNVLNRDPPIPAVQLWLSSEQYGGMTLEEFLASTQTEVTQ